MINYQFNDNDRRLMEDVRKEQERLLRQLDEVRKVRDEAIEHFKRYHGNHTHLVSVTIDPSAMLYLMQEHYPHLMTPENLAYYGINPQESNNVCTGKTEKEFNPENHCRSV